MSKSILLSGLSIGIVALALNAAEPTDLAFQNADGSGDIASADAWGAPDFASHNAVFGKTQTVTARSDVSFAGKLKVTSGTVTFDMRDAASGASTGPRKLTFGGPLYPFGNSTGLILKGGLWDLTSHGFFGQPDNYNNSGNQITVTDGAVVTNVTALTATAYGDGGTSHLSIQGGSRVYANVLNGSGTYGKNTTVEITDGATVSLQNADASTYVIQTEATQYSGSNNGILISGEGTEVSARAGTVAAGRYARDSWISVEDGARLVLGAAGFTVGTETRSSNAVFRASGGAEVEMGAGQLTVGNQGCGATLEITGEGTTFAKGVSDVYVGKNAAATNATIRVADGGSFVSEGGAIYLGNDGAGGRLEILSGASFRTGGVIYIGGYGNSGGTTEHALVVDRARFDGPMPKLGFRPNASNSVVRLANYAEFYPTTSESVLELFQRAPYCTFVIDSASFNAEKPVAFSKTSGMKTHHCRLEVVNGGQLIVSSSSFSIATLDYAEPSNTVFVGANSLISASSISINSIGNTMVVSNGTVEAMNGNFTVCQEYQFGSNFNTNGWLVLQGSTPRVSADNGLLQVWRDSHVVFDLPEEGYGDETPVTANEIYFDASSHLDLTGAENYFRNRTSPVSKTLMTASSKLTISDAQIAAANATLPRNLVLSRSADKLSLVLTTRPGLTLILR